MKKSFQNIIRLKTSAIFIVSLMLGAQLISVAFAQQGPTISSPVVIYDDLQLHGRDATENGRLWVTGNIYINDTLGGNGVINIGSPGINHLITGAMQINGNMQASQATRVAGQVTAQTLNINGSITLNGQQLDLANVNAGNGGSGRIYENQSAAKAVNGAAFKATTVGCDSADHIMVSCNATISPQNADILWYKNVALINGKPDKCYVVGSKRGNAQNATIKASVQCYAP